MDLDIVIPEVGESVREAVLAEWFVKPGERVGKGTVLFVLETDKVTLEVPADADGVVEILVPAGQTVTVGTVVGRLRAEAETIQPAETVKTAPEPAEAPFAPTPPAREPAQDHEPVAAAPAPEVQKAAAVLSTLRQEQAEASLPSDDVFPSVSRLASQMGVDLTQVSGTGPGGRITRGDLFLFLESQGRFVTPSFFASTGVPGKESPPTILEKKESPVPSLIKDGRDVPPQAGVQENGEETRKPMSPIRKRIAQRLLQAKQTTAMLTTFNEVDMSRVVEFRRRYKEAFKKKYGVSLGFMSFFVKACVQALKEIPEVNAFIDGEDIVYHRHVHMGIAVGAQRGLVVPVIRYADRLSFADIEKAIDDFVQKIQANRLQLRDLEGGTFTISNGGIYGSLLSTPILNPPQSAILGLHKIEDRPIALNGQVVIRPMMYVALSYDHRLIDGREAVTFLRRVKEGIEEPERLLVGI
ncbi:2-oxoglutarate dehydrogenase complex dihydrolipoyllysine-residue succinyltransferase [Desulfosoma caldarium]|uniref:Dihydrolipoyllysine-residue succinyltransferase component of 2-oxoglutarate dehydrogenase complex n=1 Tax=Desulfosoma caldarium TaxID=610254 RepID=A0A3N1UME4_9BACT|nr:2-oxoglutarate dehydrogenase complex dihydrolipoyllysine-residue succinyltransferase [Desulfosoma caldarium]ROQ89607.1 2-oxoglutarate dehydrogenase E2 component [Desulfosoma caldarium]